MEQLQIQHQNGVADDKLRQVKEVKVGPKES